MHASHTQIVGMLHSYSCNGGRVQLLRVFVRSSTGKSAIEFAQSFCDQPQTSSRLFKS